VRPAGPTDPAVPVVYVETPGGKPIAAYVNYALHLDTTGGMQFSADYSYMLGKVLRETKSQDLVEIFTIGCAGNVNHLDVTSDQPQSGYAQSARIGAVLAAAVLKAIHHAPVADVPFIHVSTEIVPLATPEVTPKEAEWAQVTAANFGKPDAPAFLDLVRAAKDMEVIALHGRPLEAEVQVIALGDRIAFVGLPGEIFTELGLTLKQDSPYANTIIAELANGALGYIPNRQAYAEGAYEVVSSRCAPGSGELLMNSALRQLIALFRLR
jgi:neutral ceramidase